MHETCLRDEGVSHIERSLRTAEAEGFEPSGRLTPTYRV